MKFRLGSNAAIGCMRLVAVRVGVPGRVGDNAVEWSGWGLTAKKGEHMAARLTDRQKKKIVADYIQLESFSAVARLNGVSKDTVRRVVQSCDDFAREAQQKKEQNAADIMAYMESQKPTVCGIIDNGLKELSKPEKFAEASPSQITTALGTLIDKWAMIQEKHGESGERVEVIIDV